ncbi:restriction endonuclease subunit S [Roseinatronobacter thiooxidans]|uniref:restriction endonuclease subunit S n=1 Tax=Roseinatronobacter thiooxidans TaxID=121821 RepID=UPI00201164DD|nr:restriction endonuclease subunit S [Roseinatronobacter thiooxidans]
MGRDLREDHFSELATQSHIFPVFSNTVENNGLYGFYDFQEYHGDALTIVGRGIGLGRAFYKEGGFGAIGRLLVLRSKDESFCARFLSDYVNHILRIHNESGGIPQLPGSSLSNYWVTLPPLAEQRRIAEVLGVWDRAIEVAGKQLDLARTQKRALMQTLLTPTRRFPGYEGQPWKEVRLGDVLEINYGKSPIAIADDNGDVPIIGTGGQTGFSKTALASGPCIVIGRKGTIDKPKFVNGPFWAIDTTFYCTANNGFDIGFLFNFLQSVDLKKFNEASGVPSLSRETLRSIQLNVPSESEQRQISDVISIAETEITTLETQITRLQAEKKALMQQLLTGQKRLAV